MKGRFWPSLSWLLVTLHVQALHNVVTDVIGYVNSLQKILDVQSLKWTHVQRLEAEIYVFV